MDTNDSGGNPGEHQPRRAGWWSKIGGGPLLFAALFHAALLIGGGFWIFQVIKEPEKKVDFMPSGESGRERGAEYKVQQKQRAQITPTTNTKRVFAEGAKASYAIPEQGESFSEMSSLSSLSGGGISGGLGGAGLSNGGGVHDGPAIGGGGGKLFGLIPESMRKRCSKEDRLARLKENGGTPACEDAVLKSLRWLKTQQKPDGSWGKKHGAAMTGLALLAYFGHCETPASDEFGESCMKGIAYLVNLGMKNDGKMASDFTDNIWVYEHAIATYALAEAATFCKELKMEVPSLMEVTEKAGQFIIDNQNQKGGWAYAYATDDGKVTVSITGWQIQALKACSHTNVKYKGMAACVSKGLKFLDTCQNENGGFGYMNSKEGNSGYFTLTGVGMLCNQMWGKGRRAEVAKAAKYVLGNTKFDYNTEFCDLYGHYYESQAMMQIGGKEWKQYNEMLRDQLLNNQDADGSWKTPGGGTNPRASSPVWQKDKLYRTCLCTLMMEVYYRFLNSSGGGAKGESGI